MNNPGKINSKQMIYEYLNYCKIGFEITEHKAVYNMVELSDISLPYPEVIAKNLFLRDDKKHNYYLITVKSNKRIDLKAIKRNYGTRPLSLAKEEELRNILGLTPGTVTPFGILNDKECKTLFFLDEDFLASPAIIGIHPNYNTSTVWLKVEDLLHIIEKHVNKVRIIST